LPPADELNRNISFPPKMRDLPLSDPPKCAPSAFFQGGFSKIHRSLAFGNSATPRTPTCRAISSLSNGVRFVHGRCGTARRRIKPQHHYPASTAATLRAPMRADPGECAPSPFFQGGF
jgi:hypothetical protein